MSFLQKLKFYNYGSICTDIENRLITCLLNLSLWLQKDILLIELTYKSMPLYLHKIRRPCGGNIRILIEERIKIFRNTNEMKQEELTEKTGFASTTISSW